jgi:DNA-binding ferritin-like protein
LKSLPYTSGLTSNYNNYSAIELEKALQSWVEPYPKPIIMNHDLNTEPIGRVMAAKMDKEADGSPFVRLQIAITDPVAAQKVLDKRYLTGSVGGRAAKAVCSISGDDLAAESDMGKPRAPKFRRGQVYKGKLAFIDMQDISFKEYSFVNQPADGKSGVRATTVIGDDKTKASSEGWVAKSSAFVLHMNEEDIYSFDESASILSGMKKKESRPMYLHLKGAFLTAIALQESESEHNKAISLLSNEDVEKEIDPQENLNMKDNVTEEDILATVQTLSQDLSTIAANPAQESDPEEAPAEEAPAEEIPAEEIPVAEESVKVEEEEGNGTAASLQKVLNNTLVFYFAAHRAHWNVEGEDFAEYHELFSNIYEDAIESVDPIAENIRKVQSFPANLTEIVMNADFKDDCDCKDAMGMAQMLLEKIMMLNASILSAFTVANEANEQGVANLMAERDDMTKKWAWQLRSSLKMEAGEPADESWRITKSEVITETTEEPEEEAVDSSVPEDTEVDQAAEESQAELTGDNQVSEQNADDSKKLQMLEVENQKLKSALHRTLAERVVDAKIATGVESQEVREELIEEHTKRSSSSLADSLRDLANMPAAKNAVSKVLEMTSEVQAIEGEDNVFTLDATEPEVEEKVTNMPEQVFVDALMGRRKL